MLSVSFFVSIEIKEADKIETFENKELAIFEDISTLIIEKSSNIKEREILKINPRSY